MDSALAEKALNTGFADLVKKAWTVQFQKQPCLIVDIKQTLSGLAAGKYRFIYFSPLSPPSFCPLQMNGRCVFLYNFRRNQRGSSLVSSFPPPFFVSLLSLARTKYTLILSSVLSFSTRSQFSPFSARSCFNGVFKGTDCETIRNTRGEMDLGQFS